MGVRAEVYANGLCPASNLGHDAMLYGIQRLVWALDLAFHGAFTLALTAKPPWGGRRKGLAVVLSAQGVCIVSGNGRGAGGAARLPNFSETGGTSGSNVWCGQFPTDLFEYSFVELVT